jgi:hypothetical protein
MEGLGIFRQLKVLEKRWVIIGAAYFFETGCEDHLENEISSLAHH